MYINIFLIPQCVALVLRGFILTPSSPSPSMGPIAPQSLLLLSGMGKGRDLLGSLPAAPHCPRVHVCAPSMRLARGRVEPSTSGHRAAPTVQPWVATPLPLPTRGPQPARDPS
eukprot:1211293-Pleurochrysis_carterae.AAC.4